MTAQIQYKNENYKYFNEIGAGIGVAIFHDNSTQINLEAAEFIEPNIGIRTGIISYSEMSHSKWGFKVPVLLAFRTSNTKLDYDYDYDYENQHRILPHITSDLMYSLLFNLPMRFEFNIGPAIGYLHPNKENKELNTEEKRKREDYFLNTRLLVTLDANVKASFVIKQVNIGISGGVSLLATRNYKYYAIDDFADEKDGKIARWMGNISFNASYRF